MIRVWPKSIFLKASICFLALVFLLSAVQYLLLSRLWKTAVDEREQLLSWNIAETIAARLTPLTAEQITDGSAGRKIFEMTELNPRIEVYLLRQDGSVLTEIPTTVFTAIAHRQIDVGLLDEFISLRRRRDLPLKGVHPLEPDNKYAFSAAPITIVGEPGYVYVVLNGLKFRTADRGVETWYVVFGGAITSAAISIGAFLLGLLLFTLLTRRLKRIMTAVHNFANGNYHVRVPVSGRDEISQLSSEFNQMADTITSSFRDLEELEQLRRELVAGISHDIGGPLTQIISQQERIINEYNSLSTEECISRLTTAHKNAWSLRRLIDELFELSTYEGREVEPQWEAFSILDLISEEVVPRYRYQARELGINLQTEMPNELPRVWGDPVMIERVICNLVENALRYSSKGSNVSIVVQLLAAGTQISLQDNGPGMSEIEKEKIFERFFRGSASHGKEGSGLGLALVKQILSLHNQNIELQSKPGEGSCFSFSLNFAGTATVKDSQGIEHGKSTTH